MLGLLLDDANRRKATLISGISILLIHYIFFVVYPLRAVENCDSLLPILCSQFPTDGADLAATLSDSANSSATWRANLFWDFPYIIIYVIFLASLGAAISVPHPKIFQVVLVTAGALDLVENLLILGALNSGASDATASLVFVAASLKFALLLACIVHLVWLRSLYMFGK